MVKLLPDGLVAERFRFLDRRYDAASGEASLAYSFDDGEPLIERIVFPGQPWPSEPARQAAFERALALLHLVAGVSYYKACVPAEMDTGDHGMDESMADFLNTLYLQGLGEFAYCNDIDLGTRINFQASQSGTHDAVGLDLPDRALVAMGGGKDSLVSLELLREGGVDVQPVCVGHSELITGSVRPSGLPLVRIGRQLSAGLRRLNEAGALNGHVPVTAINSAILLCAAILYGYRQVVFSNESSADEATLVDSGGRPVNHQYSKSLAFENDFRAVVRRGITADIDYFSLLRPFKELAIAERFSCLKQYHNVFSSCNRNFHIDGPRTGRRWCGSCPKCRFTALALAPFMEADELLALMGIDMLDREDQEEGFRALCRLGVEKPFECVGSLDESRAAILCLASKPGWQDRWNVRTLAPELFASDVPAFEQLLASRGPHNIPATVLEHVAL